MTEEVLHLGQNFDRYHDIYYNFFNSDETGRDEQTRPVASSNTDILLINIETLLNSVDYNSLQSRHF